ncbi:MAG: hypothetical protein M1830_009064 [Pleopsidium flavum]|nr:MAG: hypothetical protein M1830_009064 [Pleopsidium flavum]
MASTFWAGYISGAAGILIGNPLDVLKVRLQAGEAIVTSSPQSITAHFENVSSLIKGVTAPILGYGALNALLFVSYNRSLVLLNSSAGESTNLTGVSLVKIWLAGAAGGLATWAVSAPTELIKCRTQLSDSRQSSWIVAKEVWKSKGVRGLYSGGGVTSIRDAVGYGFYFWSYELSKQWISTDEETDRQRAVKVLLCGGFAGVVTWASIFPLDVIKTRVQAQILSTHPEQQFLVLAPQQREAASTGQRGAIEIAKHAYLTEGIRVFFRGLGVCSVRAFIVNAVQWTVYEWIMRALKPK